MINVVLADDHNMIVDGIKLMLDMESDINLVGEANNGDHIIKFLREQPIDIAILDLEMPGKGGIELAEIIKDEFPHVKILILTMYNDPIFIKRLIEIGANGYILKNKGKEELVEAIRDIATGKNYYGRDVTNTLVSGIQKDYKKTSSSKEILLTKREKEVLRLIGNGKSTPQIAEELFIAHSTVETHRRNLLDKIGVPNSKAMIKWAIENDYAD